jgi:predicted dienelactone hydrolase
MRRAVLVLLAATLAGCGRRAAPAGEPEERSLKLGDLDVVEWAPSGGARERRPVVLFSHGFHGCATQSRFLMEALVRAGYVAYAPNHRDATCHGGSASLLDRAEEPFERPEAWSDATFADRMDDMRAVISRLRADPRLESKIDWSRMALAGHSLGGYTVLSLAGAQARWKLPGVKAVLALSPYTEPLVRAHGLARLTAPVMYQGGTLDAKVTPVVAASGGAYDQSPSPRYFVSFEGAGHLAWADIGRRAHALIAAESLAFLDRHVRGKPAAPELTRAGPGIAELRHDP